MLAADVPVADGLARAAGVLFLCEGRVLLMQRGAGGDYAGTWAFPGGGIEDGETPLEAAQREVWEETGKRIDLEGKEPHARRLADGVDFTCFKFNTETAFKPELNDEHGAFMWCSPQDLPSNLHPGVPIMLAALDFHELDFARAIRDGQLAGPHHYKNVWLFDIRITGTGSAYRSGKEEYTWRDPSIYLNDDFVERCNGLPVLWEHTEAPMLNTDEYNEKNIGSVMLPYIDQSGTQHPADEVWAVAKIYDEPAALLMMRRQADGEHMSTSPGVILSGSTPGHFVTHSDGRKILVETPPSLLDHIAICEAGVWDKAEAPRGVNITGDQIVADQTEEEKTKAEQDRKDAETREAAEKAEKDASAGTPLDKVLSHMDAAFKDFGARMDRQDADMKAMKDAMPKKDAEEPKPGEAEKLAADKKDADEKAEKDRKDAEEKEEKDRRDAEMKSLKDSNESLKAKLDEVEGKVKERDPDEERELTDAQSRCDSVATKFGDRAPRPLAGEAGLAYRRRLLGPYVQFSTEWKDKDLARMDRQVFEVAEGQILAAADRAASDPARAEPGKLRPVSNKQGGHEIITYHGEPRTWMDSLAGHARQHVTGFKHGA
jgi:8-oxo-dGTP pyrophosphatase MutT (NUDIX family)